MPRVACYGSPRPTGPFGTPTRAATLLLHGRGDGGRAEKFRGTDKIDPEQAAVGVEVQNDVAPAGRSPTTFHIRLQR